MNIKTVYSCIQNINDFFQQWIGSDMIIPVKKTGFIVKNEFFLDGELQFLMDQITYHEDLNYEDKINLQNKLRLFSSLNQQVRMVESEPSFKKQTFSLFLNLTTIMRAIEKKNVISFEYINYDVHHHHFIEKASLHGNKGKQYFVSPYQVISQNNHYYLVGYNKKYQNELSIYRVDRMRLIQTVHQPFIEIREQFEMKEEIQKMTNMFSSQSKESIQMICDASILREVVSHFGMDCYVERMYDHRYRVTVQDVPISDGFIGWIMMLQEHIQIVTPVHLKETIKNKMEKMLSLYD